MLTYRDSTLHGAARIAFLLCAFKIHAAGEAPVDPLPEPLSLDYILQQLDVSEHPDLLMSAAQRQAVKAESEGADAVYATEAEINLEAAWIDPSQFAFDTSTHDHRASLNVRKRLYEFGVTGTLGKAFDSMLAASDIDVDYARALHRIEIARLYFDVLLADMEYGWANEAMAMEYVTLDKKRERYALKQVDEIELLEEESRYQLSLAERTDAALKQRVSRARLALALALARPGQLPADLEIPELAGLHTAPAEPEELVGAALAHAPQIRSQSRRLDAARYQHAADANRWYPSLDAELEVAEYSRDLPSRENWRAGIKLKLPLYESGQNGAQAARSWSAQMRELARYRQLQSDIREDIYSSWQNITTLISRSKALQTSVDFADRALGKSRGEYELELRTDFGDAQVRVSKTRLDKATNDYRLVLEKMQLALMLGEDPVGVLFTPDNDR